MSKHYVEKQQLEIPSRNLHRKSIPICPKCNQSCLKDEGDFVRAFNNVYHYKCFICEVMIIGDDRGTRACVYKKGVKKKKRDNNI